ncbi:unnamed protein product [Amoebophrya sp. A25]|nr:unnamed protein product [Amoebophrya sp. A25]|eukprot:GSA25T00020058001.1
MLGNIGRCVASCQLLLWSTFWVVHAGSSSAPPIYLLHDGHTKTDVQREVVTVNDKNPEVYWRIPRAVGAQKFKLSQDKQWLFVPHPVDENDVMHAHFARHLRNARDEQTEYGYAWGAFTAGQSSAMLERNCGQFTFRESVIESTGGPAIAPEKSTVVLANQTWSDPVKARQSIDPGVRDEQIFATLAFLATSANNMNRYHVMDNPAMMQRLRDYAESDMPKASLASSSKMAAKITAHGMPVLEKLRNRLDQVDLSATPTKVNPAGGTCNHFETHRDLHPDSSFNPAGGANADGDNIDFSVKTHNEKGGWVRLHQLYVQRRGEVNPAGLPWTEFPTGVTFFHYNEERDHVELLTQWYSFLHIEQHRPPIAPVAYYKEYPVPGFSTAIPDIRIRDNQPIWQSEVAKYWYGRMWELPVDNTLFWPDADTREMSKKCSKEFLEEDVLEEMRVYDWRAVVTRTKQDDPNLVTSDAKHSDSFDRLAVARILRKALSCAGFMGAPEFRFAYGFNYASALTLYHTLDELATNLGSRRLALGMAFSQRPKYLEYSANPAGEGRPLTPRAIPELEGIHDIVDRFGKVVTSNANPSARFESESVFGGHAHVLQVGNKMGDVCEPLDFKGIEEAPLQLPPHCKPTQKCLMLTDDTLQNLRMAAEFKTLPITESLFNDKEVKHTVTASSARLQQNVLRLVQPPTSLSASERADLIAQVEEEAVLSRDVGLMNIGVSGMHDVRASGDSIFRRELQYQDWSFERTTSDFAGLGNTTRLTPAPRPHTRVFERWTRTEYYPCSAIQKTRSRMDIAPASGALANTGLSLAEGVYKFLDHVKNGDPTASGVNTRFANIASLITKTCQDIQTHCTGANSQYATQAACEADYTALPLQDSSCVNSDVAFAAKGASLSCRWVQSYLLALAPARFCPLAGSSPPAGGRCHATECSAAPGPTATTCDIATKVEIMSSTLDALPICLPDLAGSDRCSTNCTQAVTHFLGRHVESGALAACASTGLGLEADGSGSLVLSLLQVNAKTLLRRCAPAHIETAGMFGAVAPVPATAQQQHQAGESLVYHENAVNCAHDPTLYLSENGCQRLNWLALEEKMISEWQAFGTHAGATSAAFSNANGVGTSGKVRRTTHDAIGYREEFLFDLWFSNYHNHGSRAEARAQAVRKFMMPSAFQLILPDGSTQPSGTNANYQQELYTRGSGSARVAKYYGLVDALGKTQIRNGVSGVKGLAGTDFADAWFEQFPDLTKYMAEGQNSFTPAHDAARELTFRLHEAMLKEPELTMAGQAAFQQNARTQLGKNYQYNTYPVWWGETWALDNLPELWGPDGEFDLKKNVYEQIIRLVWKHPVWWASRWSAVAGAHEREMGYFLYTTSLALHRPEHSHRSEGYLSGTGMITKTTVSLQGVKTKSTFAAESVAAWTSVRSRLPAVVDESTGLSLSSLEEEIARVLETGHFAGQSLAYGKRLPQIMFRLIMRLREDLCGLGRDWQSGGLAMRKRIFLEFMRTEHDLHQPLTFGEGSSAATAKKTSYDIAAHHRDERYFPHPEVFDPMRANLEKVYIFGALEEDIAVSETGVFGDTLVAASKAAATAATDVPDVIWGFSGRTAPASAATDPVTDQYLELPARSKASAPMATRRKRLQHACLGRNAALRFMFQNIGEYLHTPGSDGFNARCSSDSRVREFVHHGVELRRQMLRVPSATDGKKVIEQSAPVKRYIELEDDIPNGVYQLESFVHGKLFGSPRGLNFLTDRASTYRDDEDFDGTLWIFLNGFAHAPQMWTNIVKHMHEDRPGATSVLLNLPGWGKDATRINDCDFNGVPSDIIVNLIRKAKLTTDNWSKIYLVGDTNIGSYLAWASAHKLREVVDAGPTFKNEESDSEITDADEYLTGLVSFAPHPELALKPMFVRLEPAQFPWYPLLNPIVGEMALGMLDFKVLQNQMEETLGDAKWYPGSSLKADYMKFWKNTGARPLTCYFRDNFEVVKGKMQAKSDWYTDLRPAGMHILLIKAEREISYSREQWIGSFTFVPRAAAKHHVAHTISDSGTNDLFFDLVSKGDRFSSTDCAQEVGEEMSRFAFAAYMADLPLVSVFKISLIPPQLTGGWKKDLMKQIALPFVLMGALVATFGGLYLEFKMGDVWITLQHKEAFWRFGQVVMVPICMACFASGSWLGLPLFFMALYKFGFPEITTLLRSPWLLRHEDHWVDNWARFWDGVGYVVHHTATGIIYAGVLGHMVDPMLIALQTLPLGFQHLVSPLKYANEHVYNCLLPLLELWYECEAFFVLPCCSNPIVLFGLIMLLSAHWLWLARQIVWIPLNIWVKPPEAEEEVIDEKTGKKSTVKKKSESRRASVFMTESHAARTSVKKETFTQKITRRMSALTGLDDPTALLGGGGGAGKSQMRQSEVLQQMNEHSGALQKQIDEMSWDDEEDIDAGSDTKSIKKDEQIADAVLVKVGIDGAEDHASKNKV